MHSGRCKKGKKKKKKKKTKSLTASPFMVEKMTENNASSHKGNVTQPILLASSKERRGKKPQAKKVGREEKKRAKRGTQNRATQDA